MIKVGQIIRYIELQNKYIFQHFLLNKQPLPSGFPIFIEIYANTFIPYFIETAVKKSDDIIVLTFQTTLSMQVVKENIIQKDIFFRNQDFLTHAGFNSPLRYTDFDVYDKQDIVLGKIKTIFEHQHKWCLQICNQENEEMFVYLYNKNIQEAFAIDITEKKLILL